MIEMTPSQFKNFVEKGRPSEILKHRAIDYIAFGNMHGYLNDEDKIWNRLIQTFRPEDYEAIMLKYSDKCRLHAIFLIIAQNHAPKDEHYLLMLYCSDKF